MDTGVVIVVGVVVALVVAYVVVDLLGSSHQRRRLDGGRNRSDIDEFRARDDKIQNSSYASFTARSVRDRDRRP